MTTGPLSNTLSAAMAATAPAGRPPLAYDQVRKLVHAVNSVVANGHGEVRVVFEDGQPRRLEVTFSLLAGDVFTQLAELVARVQATGYAGHVALVTRNGKVTRLEVTTSEPLTPPASSRPD